jgi:phosphoribosylanthranilate isomerase
MLRIPVKINGVNNLSDARYCAGMGVDMIGFSVSENQARYLPSDVINGITGWLSGVQIVTEGYFGEKPIILASKAEAIHSSLLEVDALMYKGVSFPSFQMMYRLNLREWDNLQELLPEDSFLHIVLEKNDISNSAIIQEICAKRKTFLNGSLLDLPILEQLLLETKPHGITLDGGNELSPGVIDFEHLAEVLEYLEV